MGSFYSLRDLKGGGLGSALRVHDFSLDLILSLPGLGMGSMHDFLELKEGVIEMM